MESIKSQTIEIYPKFWKDFNDSLPKIIQDMSYNTNLVDQDKLEPEYQYNSKSELSELQMLLNLYIFIVEESQSILNSNCDKFEQILQTMSIVSLWSIEFEKYLKNKLKLSTAKTNKIMTEILEFSNVEHSTINYKLEHLLDEQSKSQSVAYQKHIEYVKEKINNLYLKLICY